MDINKVVAIITSLPISKTSGDQTYWKQAAPQLAAPVVTEIAYAFDWDWLMRLDDSHSTAVNTSEYVIRGSEKNIYDIVNIRIGDTVLNRYRTLDGHDLLANGAEFGGVKAWFQDGVDSGGFPNIRLLDTPDSVQTLKILYRRANIGVAEIPDHFSSVVAYGILAMMDPKYDAIYQRRLKEKIVRHKLGGKDINLVQLDPHIVQTNNTIAELYNAG